MAKSVSEKKGLKKDKTVVNTRRSAKRKHTKQVSASSLIELLPKDLFESVSEQTQIDYQVKHLSGKLMVLLLIYAIIEEKDDSLRNLEDLYNSKSFKIFSGKGGHTTRHSSLASRLQKINTSFFEQLYQGFLDKVKAKYGKKLEKEFGWLIRFDSTMVALSASLSEIGMRVGPQPKKGAGKAQIKFTIGLAGLLPEVAQVFHDQEHLAEEKALYHTIQSCQAGANSVFVFDMGLKSRKRFESLSEKGRFFVTRLKNPRYQIVRTNKVVEGRQAGKLRLQQDLIVQLFVDGASKPLPTEFRLLIAQCEQGENAGQTLFFLTNILDLTARQISEIYRRRWDIEVFFRFLKQELGLNHLLAYNQNGITAVFYVRLLTATLLRLYMWLNKRNDYKISKTAFALEIQWEIMLTLVQLSGGNIKNINENLADFQGFRHPPEH